METSASQPVEGRPARQRLVFFLIVAAGLEVLWTVYLGLRLPPHYVANHWDLAWVGFDIGQIVLMLLTAWTAWRRRAMFIIYASMLATLFIMDAWFDVTTARRGDAGFSKLSAGLLEIPFAILLLWAAGRTIHRLAGLAEREEQRVKSTRWKVQTRQGRPVDPHS